MDSDAIDDMCMEKVLVTFPSFSHRFQVAGVPGLQCRRDGNLLEGHSPSNPQKTGKSKSVLDHYGKGWM
jgi:hypothetical protein